ncbi:hypothetical protein BG015_000565 [Linnemannia schmuckeri]|uniref:Uncharacterized protein n=1 Tax=Linnemannia schmuckeri TaxID=64567 RepID=A0A9P5S410_9FUNG|nr:hypothetical protein BG015_000565 [Linnemannia schmuckeri]
MTGRRLFAPSVFYLAVIAAVLVLQVLSVVQSAPVALSPLGAHIQSEPTGQEQVLVKRISCYFGTCDSHMKGY